MAWARACRLPVLVVALTGALAPAASASQMVGFGGHHVRLAVNGHGRALVSFTRHGVRHRVLAWGAVNALPPTPGARQVRFRLRYHPRHWRRIHDRCAPYAGPRVVRAVALCTAPDGSFWAVQRWRRLQPNGGWPLVPGRSRLELHLSHWTGPLPHLWLKWDWSYPGLRRGPFDHLYGRFTYRGRGVYGFGSTPQGDPTDGFGRNVYVDTFDSPWGRGWKRLNSFLSHRPHGNFCDSAFPNRYGRTTPGRGTRYRALAMGPGVTPIVRWIGPPPGPYRAGAHGDPLDYHLVADHRLPFNPRVDRALDAEEQRVAGSPSDRCWNTH